MPDPAGTGIPAVRAAQGAAGRIERNESGRAVAYPVQGSAAIQETALSVMTDRTTPGTEALNPAGNASEDKVHTICSVTAQTANVEIGVVRLTHGRLWISTPNCMMRIMTLWAGFP